MKSVSSRRRVLMGLSATAISAPVLWGRPARSAPTQLKMLSSRKPPTEYYVGKMQSAIPNVTLEAQQVTLDKVLELTNIAMAAKSPSVDILYANESFIPRYARNGWLKPLDALWEKHSDEFNLSDFSKSTLDLFRYKGELFGIPLCTYTMVFPYRKDLFDAAGKQPPKTIAETLALAKALNSPTRAGICSMLMPVDACLNESHWYLNALGDGWFDQNWNPVLNSERGIKAIEALKEATRYAQPGFLTATSDEGTVAFQQDAVYMGLSWVSRAAGYDDPKLSRVVGKIQWVAPPQGGTRITTDGYGISPYSTNDPELSFRMLVAVATPQNMREAAKMVLPVRSSVLDDAEMRKSYRFLPAAAESIKTSVPIPPIPEMYPAGEFICRRILQAVTGEMTVAAAMNAAASETKAYLKSKGYYQ